MRKHRNEWNTIRERMGRGLCKCKQPVKKTLEIHYTNYSEVEKEHENLFILK